MVIIWIIVALLMFTIIVVIHELWHFWAARKFGVKVYEFGVWLPPKAKKLFTDKKGTDYALNWLPFWGYVKLAWENLAFFKIYDENWNKLEDEALNEHLTEWNPIYDENWNEIPVNDVSEIRKALEENKASYSLVNKPYWQQVIIVLGGVFMNFALASVIFAVLFMVWVKPIWVNTTIPTDREVLMLPTYETAIEKGILEKWEGLILNPAPESISKEAGIKKYDNLISISWEKVSNFEDLQQILKDNSGKEVSFEIIREWQEINLKITPDENWKIWSYIWENIAYSKEFEYKFWPLESLKMWAVETYNQSMLTLESLGFLMKNIFSPEKPEDRKEALDSVAGPIWIIGVISKTFTEWIAFLFIIWAIISVNLWVFNLLPIPALDWWRFLFIITNWFWEGVFKRKFITPKIESFIHVWFFMLLIVISLAVAFKDIKTLIW